MASNTKKSSKDKKGKKTKAVKKEAPKRTADELMADATEYVKAKGKDSVDYKRIQEILEVTPKGRPARVIVECSDPQVNGDDQSVCVQTREIAIQDLHQVKRCIPCQERSVQVYRNKLAKKRRVELSASRGEGNKKGKKGKKDKKEKSK